MQRFHAPTRASVILTATFAWLAFPSAVVGSQQASPTRTVSDADWPGYNRSHAGDRFSPLRQINTTNVSRLRSVCTFDAKERVAFQTGPLVVGGTLYFTTDTNSYAIDAATCALRWKQRTSQAATYLKANRGFGVRERAIVPRRRRQARDGCSTRRPVVRSGM